MKIAVDLGLYQSIRPYFRYEPNFETEQQPCNIRIFRTFSCFLSIGS